MFMRHGNYLMIGVIRSRFEGTYARNDLLSAKQGHESDAESVGWNAWIGRCTPDTPADSRLLSYAKTMRASPSQPLILRGCSFGTYFIPFCLETRAQRDFPRLQNTALLSNGRSIGDLLERQSLATLSARPFQEVHLSKQSISCDLDPN